MLRLTRRIALAAIVLLPMAAGCGGSGGGGKAVNLSFIPADSHFALVAHPKDFFSLPEAKNLSAESLQELERDVRRFGNFGFQDVAEVVAVADIPAEAKPPAWGIVVRFAPGSKTDGFFPIVKEKGEEATVEGKKCYHSKNKSEPWFCWADEQTAILAEEPMLKRMLTAAPTDGSALHQRLKAADGAAHLNMVVVGDAARQHLKKLLENAPPFPGLSQLPDQLASAEFRFKGENPGKIMLVLHGVDEAGGKGFETLVQSLITLAKGYLPMAFGQGGPLASDPKMAQFKDKATGFMDAVKITRAGSDVTVGVEKQDMTKDLLAAMSEAMVANKAAAQVAQARSQMWMMQITIDQYKQVNGKLPESLEVLSKPGKNPGDGPLIEAQFLNDPWGKPFQYRMPGKEGAAFELFSFGPDGKPDTADDIKSEPPVRTMPSTRTP